MTAKIQDAALLVAVAVSIFQNTPFLPFPLAFCRLSLWDWALRLCSSYGGKKPCEFIEEERNTCQHNMPAEGFCTNGRNHASRGPVVVLVPQRNSNSSPSYKTGARRSYMIDSSRRFYLSALLAGLLTYMVSSNYCLEAFAGISKRVISENGSLCAHTGGNFLWRGSWRNNSQIRQIFVFRLALKSPSNAPSLKTM